VTPDDRPRGALSPADRGYLCNPDDYSRQASHEREERIEERVRNALLDFTLLFRHLDDEQAEEIFDGLDDDTELRRGIKHALAFLFDGAATPKQGPNISFSEEGASKKLTSAGWFDKLLEEAYVLALIQYDFIVDEFEPPTVTGEHIEGIDKARRMAEAGEEFSPRYIQMLLHTDVIDSEPVQEAVRERLLEDVSPPAESADDNTDSEE